MFGNHNNNKDNNENLYESRSQYFQDLDYSQNSPQYPPETPQRVPAEPATAPAKRKGTFLPALLGALVGGLIVAVLLISFYFLAGDKLAGSKVVESGSSEAPVINQILKPEDSASAVEAVAQVVPHSVVGIYVEGTTISDSIFGRQANQYTSIGSGFFVTEDGYVVTNQHVITSSPEKITVSTSDGNEYNARAVWSDSNLDIAVIKVEDISDAQALSLGDSADLNVGQSVIAVGNPLGLTYSRSVTSGIISAIDRSLVVDNTLIAEGLIQTDAAINQGNSGGPLVNMEGEVIGVNTYKQTQGEGMGFAIPINLFKPIIKQVVETGSFQPITIGITGYDPEQAYYMSYGQIPDFGSGIYVAEVTENSPAQAAGLQQGDIIKSIDGSEVNTMIQLRTILYNHNDNDTVNVVYERGGKEYQTQITLKAGD